MAKEGELIIRNTPALKTLIDATPEGTRISAFVRLVRQVPFRGVWVAAPDDLDRDGNLLLEGTPVESVPLYEVLLDDLAQYVLPQILDPDNTDITFREVLDFLSVHATRDHEEEWDLDTILDVFVDPEGEHQVL